MPFQVFSVTDQKAALRQIGAMISKGSIDPSVRRAAKAITADVDARDDLGELEALYTALKEGTDRVPGLGRGFRYVADPRAADFFQSAAVSLTECREGACAGDCDDSSILIGALAGALGFNVGARAYAPPGSGSFTHVYAVATVPKRGPWPAGYSGHALDITVPEATVGWEPSRGRVSTFWLYPLESERGGEDVSRVSMAGYIRRRRAR